MPEKKDNWDRFDVVVKALGGVLVPVVLLVVGQTYTNQQRDSDAKRLAQEKQNEADQREADRAMHLVDLLVGRDSLNAIAATKMATYFAEKHQLPGEVVPVLLAIANRNNVKPSPEDVSPAGVRGGSARALESIAQTPESKTAQTWVYLGATDGRTMLTSTFQEPGVPSLGAKLTARSDLYKRAAVPSFQNEQWVLGDIIGIVPAGQSFSVNEIQKIPGTHARDLLWARIDGAIRQASAENSTDVHGRVKWFNRAKGFGYITLNDGREAYVHYSSIVDTGYKSLDGGENVALDVVETPKGPTARNVRRAHPSAGSKTPTTAASAQRR